VSAITRFVAGPRVIETAADPDAPVGAGDVVVADVVDDSELGGRVADGIDVADVVGRPA
jgi:hypothetical protein